MGFIKNLFNNDSTVVGLCDLKKRHTENSLYCTKTYALNQLFTQPIDDNILLRKML